MWGKNMMMKARGMEMECIWVVKGGLINVELSDLSLTIKDVATSGCQPNILASLLPRSGCVYVLWDRVPQGSNPSAVDKYNLVEANAFSHTTKSLPQGDVKGHLLRAFPEHFLHCWKGRHALTLSCVSRPHLEKLHPPMNMRGCLQIRWKSGQIEKNTSPDDIVKHWTNRRVYIWISCYRRNKPLLAQIFVIKMPQLTQKWYNGMTVYVHFCEHMESDVPYGGQSLLSTDYKHFFG